MNLLKLLRRGIDTANTLCNIFALEFSSQYSYGTFFVFEILLVKKIRMSVLITFTRQVLHLRVVIQRSHVFCFHEFIACAVELDD